MRRRRLIGMYRVLLKSMKWFAPDDKSATHDGAAVKARNGKQNENRARFEPNQLAYPAQSIRSSGPKFYRSARGFWGLCLNDSLWLSRHRGELAQRGRCLAIRHEIGTAGHDHIRQARRDFRAQIRSRRGAEIQGRSPPQQAARAVGGRPARSVG